MMKLTREFAKKLQQDARLVRMEKAKEANDNDQTLQDLIGKFNLKKIEINSEIQKADKNEETLKKLDDEIKALYETIMSNSNMLEFDAAKQDIDTLMDFINRVITASVNGEDVDLVPEKEESHCGSGCGGCSSSCH